MHKLYYNLEKNIFILLSNLYVMQNIIKNRCFWWNIQEEIYSKIIT